ncbi:MAG TPA: LysR substrate-binding domain-containing protein [Burkholderiaceae bacterium]|nr:LysR substrate-binding domain-containing protein [Burkholderiaceae bacterium]
MPLTLEALETVDTIARKGSFAAAAAELGKVPSALTYTVRRLEDELDVLLFDRRGPRATLTEAGRELVDQGRHLLRSADDLAARVRRVASGWEPELSIAVDALIDFDRMRALVEDFYRQGAPTRLRFSYEVLDGTWEALLEGRAHLAIGAGHDVPSPALRSTRFSIRPLGRMAFVFCVAPHHPLASVPEPLPAEAVHAHRAVAIAGTSRLGPSRTTGLLSGQETLTVATLEQKVSAQIAGLGVGWLPEPFARTHLACGRLVARRTAEPRAPEAIHYGWRRADPGNALRWWLSRLDVPVVRERLIAGPDAPPTPGAFAVVDADPAPDAAPARSRRRTRRDDR